MKRSALVVAVGLFGAAACSHNGDQKAASAGSTTTYSNAPGTTNGYASGDDAQYKAGNVSATQNKSVPGIPAMRDAVNAVMHAQPAASDTEIANALNAIAGALVDLPDGNTGDGVERIKRNVIAMNGGDDTHKALEVHASLVQAIEALRTVNSAAPNPAISTASQNLKAFSPDKPLAGQMTAVRATICSVGSAVAIAANTAALDCGNATASAK